MPRNSMTSKHVWLEQYFVARNDGEQTIGDGARGTEHQAVRSCRGWRDNC